MALQCHGMESRTASPRRVRCLGGENSVYYFASSSLASFILAESSFFCTRTGSVGSTSAAMFAVPLGERALPVGGGQLQASGFLVQITQVVVDGRIGIDFLRSLQQVLFRQFKFSQAKVSPAEGIKIGAVGGIEIHGALDVSEMLLRASCSGRPAYSPDNSAPMHVPGRWPAPS